MKNLVSGFHKLNSLQYLRALCAIAVVMFHVEDGSKEYWQSTVKISLFSWGNLGVPLFFCLSGFVIAYSGYLRPKRPWEFLYLRLARIYPAYLATALVFVTCLIIFPAGTFNSYSVSIEQLVRTLLFDFGKTGGYVYVGWTLFYEVVFYLCFSFLVFRFPTVAKSKFFYYGVASGLIFCYLFTATRIADFLIGISVFLLASKSLDKADASIPYYALLASLALGVFSHPVGLFCGAIVLSFLAFEDMFPSVFRFRPVLVMGDSSYSIYLVQVLTVSASLKTAKWIAYSFSAADNSYFVFYFLAIAFAFFSTTAIGILMRRYLEKPSYKYLVHLRNKFNGPS